VENKFNSSFRLILAAKQHSPLLGLKLSREQKPGAWFSVCPGPYVCLCVRLSVYLTRAKTS